MDTSASKSDIEICTQILQLWKIMKSNIEQFAATRDLTLQQVFMLYQLYGEDHILMGTLAKRMQCDASNVTGIIDRLQSLGLISRQELPEDRRAKQLSITPIGRELIDALLPYLPCDVGLEHLSSSEGIELRRLLDKACYKSHEQ